MASNEQPIIIKKIKKAGHAHHGGAWKIAYADFVTAMMAFFLLMWLISMTTPEQKQGLADYFAPANVSRSTSGAGGIMGGTAFDEEGARMPGTKPQVVMTVSTPAQPRSPEVEEQEAKRAAEMNELMHEKSARDESNFQNAAESIRQSMRENPALAELSRNVIVDQTPEGLRIQIVDQDGRSMFPTGLAEPYERTRQLLDEVAKVLVRLPNRVSISGHTDANPLAGRPGYSNWELTADRANATRRILEQGGLSHDRIYQVVGKADSEPLFPEDPYMAANRRLSVVLLREAPVTPPGFSP
ncbi:MAG: flagellar motor protein MotB [Parvibaculum sp.]|uniref:flagellar motor protein MotB n=1 Tax=Parvibaculum sp. TaxID=2024848 RepID=UPI002AB89197|nr:flagellar motor protein MotB [Parvibaculum sp.]MDZ4381885.1 flagellar motor protein MotB [Parvibaculum sp.]